LVIIPLVSSWSADWACFLKPSKIETGEKI
jgi:hypothetical protein